MISKIIGREIEKQLLHSIYNSEKSEFVAVYGRRRVGKTFLVREFFENELIFQTAGLAKEDTRRQIKSFYDDLQEWGLPRQAEAPRDWLDIFMLLRMLIKQSDRERKVILLDELPWMDTPRSGFVSALEHFWNAWACGRHDIVLIVCGSATSWMMDKLIDNHGGLHNRLTHRIQLNTFTLYETEQLLTAKGFNLSRYDTAMAYMALGGIPYYFDLFDNRMSLAQNIDQLLFRRNGQLSGEFNNLYAALFKNSADYVNVVEALSHRRAGLTRTEIMRATGLTSGSGLTNVLRNLETCGFIHQHRHYMATRSEASLYQLVDFFTLFHFHFLAQKKPNSWIELQGTPTFNAWTGLTFELLAWHHLRQIKQTLGISGIRSDEYAWRCMDDGTQIDLVIERADQTVNLCEMKFCIEPFTINSDYEASLRHKMARFSDYTHRRKSLLLTIVTTFGVASGAHAAIVSNEITLDNLFKQ